MELIEKIRLLRELKEMSQAELAHRIHMSTEGYAKIERGERRLDVQRLTQIANVLDIGVADLFNIINKRELYLINDNNFFVIGKDKIQASCTYSSDKELILENEKLKLALKYKNELISQKDKEIELLRKLLDKAETHNH